MYGCGKDCLILIPLRLPQISCFTLSLKCFSSDSDNCPDVRLGPLLQFPHLMRAGPGLLTLLFLPLHPPMVPSSSQVLCGSVFFCTGQVLLSTLSWCSACTCVSEGVFLIIHGERCIPCPPTPLPSFLTLFNIILYSLLYTILPWPFMKMVKINF